MHIKNNWNSVTFYATPKKTTNLMESDRMKIENS